MLVLSELGHIQIVALEGNEWDPRLRAPYEIRTSRGVLEASIFELEALRTMLNRDVYYSNQMLALSDISEILKRNGLELQKAGAF